MKIGDVVKFKAGTLMPLGVIIDIDLCGWFLVMINDDQIVLWPESQMELINESG